MVGVRRDDDPELLPDLLGGPVAELACERARRVRAQCWTRSASGAVRRWSPEGEHLVGAVNGVEEGILVASVAERLGCRKAEAGDGDRVDHLVGVYARVDQAAEALYEGGDVAGRCE